MPRGSTLPIGAAWQEAATWHREHLRDQIPFFPPGACPLGACYVWDKAQSKPWRKTDIFASKEKNSRWPNGTVLLSNRVASLVFSVWKPGQFQENPQGLVTLAYCGPWSDGPRQVKDKAIAQIPRPGNLVRLLIGSCGNNIPFVNHRVSVEPTAPPAPPVPSTGPRSGSVYPGAVEIWVVVGCCPVHRRMFSSTPGPLRTRCSQHPPKKISVGIVR